MPGYLPQTTASTDNTGGFNPSVSNTSVNSEGGPGFMGNGTYQVQGSQINQGAFLNPVSAGQTASGFTTGQNQLLTAANASAPNIGPAATSNGAGNAGQTNVANTLYGIGTGAIPGAAQQEAALQTQENTAAALSAEGSARGTANPALAGYNLANTEAGIQRTGTNAAVTGGTAERLSALSGANTAYGGVTQNTQFNANQLQQIAIQQATLKAQQMGLQGQELQNYVNNNAGQIANSMQAAQAGQTLQVNQNLGLNQIQSQAYNNAAGHSIGGDLVNLGGSIVGGASSAMTSGLLKSDIRSKKKIKPGKAVLDKFLTKIAKKATK